MNECEWKNNFNNITDCSNTKNYFFIEEKNSEYKMSSYILPNKRG